MIDDCYFEVKQMLHDLQITEEAAQRLQILWVEFAPKCFLPMLTLDCQLSAPMSLPFLDSDAEMERKRQGNQSNIPIMPPTSNRVDISPASFALKRAARTERKRNKHE